MTFKFPARVDNLDGVPEQYRPFYAEGEEGFDLDADLKAAITSGANLSTTVEKERKKAAQAERELKAFKALADTPDKIAELIQTARAEAAEEIASLKKLVDEKGDARQQFEKLKSDMEAAHRKALDAKDAQVSSIEGSLRKYLIENAAIAAISEAKGKVKPLLPAVASRLKLFQESGEYVVRVVDNDGDPRGDGKGGYLDIKGLVAELREDGDYSPLFEASGVSGSGAQGRSAPSAILPAGTKNPWDKGSLNLTEQMRLLRENPALAVKLQTAASR